MIFVSSDNPKDNDYCFWVSFNFLNIYYIDQIDFFSFTFFSSILYEEGNWIFHWNWYLSNRNDQKETQYSNEGNGIGRKFTLRIRVSIYYFGRFPILGNYFHT